MPQPKYYCEYCDRTFNDSPVARKNHIQSVHHQQMVRMWYDSFKDSSEILQDNNNNNQRSQLFPHIRQQAPNTSFQTGAMGSYVSGHQRFYKQQQQQQQTPPAPMAATATATATATLLEASNNAQIPQIHLVPPLPGNMRITDLPPSLMPPPANGWATTSNSTAFGEDPS